MLSRNGVFRAARGLKWIRRSGSRVCVTLSESHRVVHDRQQCRFTVRLEHGGKEQSAVLEYAHRGDGRVHLVSTQVPECVRGRGVAAGLAKNVCSVGPRPKPRFLWTACLSGHVANKKVPRKDACND